jgi:hypothetical protein
MAMRVPPEQGYLLIIAYLPRKANFLFYGILLNDINISVIIIIQAPNAAIRNQCPFQLLIVLAATTAFPLKPVLITHYRGYASAVNKNGGLEIHKVT